MQCVILRVILLLLVCEFFSFETCVHNIYIMQINTLCYQLIAIMIVVKYKHVHMSFNIITVDWYIRTLTDAAIGLAPVLAKLQIVSQI